MSPRLVPALLLAWGLVPLTLDAAQVAVALEGAVSLPQESLLDLLAREAALAPPQPLDPPLADDMAFALQLHYRRQGFPDALVDWRVTGPGQLALAVTEGRRLAVGAISYTGNSAFDQNTLDSYLLRPTRERVGRGTPKEGLPLVESEILSGASVLERFYQSEGYMDAKVAPPAIGADGAIRVAIEEGVRYRFGEVTFTGDADAPEAKLRQLIAENLPLPYSEPRLEQMRAALAGFYQARGHFSATVEAVADPHAADRATHAVPIRFRIAPGPLHRIGRVTVTGPEDIPPFIIKQNFAPLEGRRYNPAQVDLVQRTLLDTGLFSNISVVPETAGGDLLDLRITAEAAKPKAFGGSIGYETFAGFILGLEYRNANLARTGRGLRASVELTSLGPTGSVTLSDPAFFHSATQADLSLALQSRAFDGYKRASLELRANFTRRLSATTTLGGFVQASQNESTADGFTDAELGPASYRLVSAGASLTLDHRNNPISPTNGWFAALETRLGSNFLGGEVGFLQTSWTAAWYQPITPGWRVALGTRGGVITPQKTGEALPADLRYYNGGATTVRSYAERTLGPLNDKNIALGGQSYQVFNAEVARQVFPGLEATLFADAGNLVQESKPLDLSDLRFALGAGIRYSLPIGPVRLDYGWNPSPKEGDATGALHLSFGAAF